MNDFRRGAYSYKRPLTSALKCVRLRLGSLTGAIRSHPNFLIVGAQKGGTSSLFKYIIQHPDIEGSWKKEVHFFCRNFSKGENWYKGFFPLKVFSRNKTLGECTPYYLFHPFVARRVKSMYPKMKIIMVLREPISRAYSHYNMRVKWGDETNSFREAIIKEEERLDLNLINLENPDFISSNHVNYSYLSRGKYIEQIENWKKYFPMKQMLILFSDDLYKNPRKTMDQVYDFIGVKSYDSDKFKTVNQGLYKTRISELDKGYLREYFSQYNDRLFKFLGKENIWIEK